MVILHGRLLLLQGTLSTSNVLFTRFCLCYRVLTDTKGYLIFVTFSWDANKSMPTASSLNGCYLMSPRCFSKTCQQHLVPHVILRAPIDFQTPQYLFQPPAIPRAKELSNMCLKSPPSFQFVRWGCLHSTWETSNVENFCLVSVSQGLLG